MGSIPKYVQQDPFVSQLESPTMMNRHTMSKLNGALNQGPGTAAHLLSHTIVHSAWSYLTVLLWAVLGAVRHQSPAWFE